MRRRINREVYGMTAKNQGMQHRMQATASGDFGPVNAVPTMRCPMCSGAGHVFGRIGGRGPASARTHCTQGHELAGSNLYILPSTGWRECQTCRKAHREGRREPTIEAQNEMGVA